MGSHYIEQVQIIGSFSFKKRILYLQTFCSHGSSCSKTCRTDLVVVSVGQELVLGGVLHEAALRRQGELRQVHGSLGLDLCTLTETDIIRTWWFGVYLS